MLWTTLDEDALNRCMNAVRNCESYRTRPAAWFTLCIRMYKELAHAGLIEKVEVEQEICENCVWHENGGCHQHFEGTHVNQSSGKVLFCPRKTTPAMRAMQLAKHKKRGRA